MYYSEHVLYTDCLPPLSPPPASRLGLGSGISKAKPKQKTTEKSDSVVIMQNQLQLWSTVVSFSIELSCCEIYGLYIPQIWTSVSLHNHQTRLVKPLPGLGASCSKKIQSTVCSFQTWWSGQGAQGNLFHLPLVVLILQLFPGFCRLGYKGCQIASSDSPAQSVPGASGSGHHALHTVRKEAHCQLSPIPS